MIYLASPYSDPNPAVVAERYRLTEAATAELLRRRVWVYSPIVHCHHMATVHGLPTDAAFWRDYNEHMLGRSDELHVLCIDGWHRSLGVRHELEWWFGNMSQTQLRFIDCESFR